MSTPLYVKLVTYSRWCIYRDATPESYRTVCGARIDATEILFCAIHPPGPVCTACCPPQDEFSQGQTTVARAISVDMLDDADAYQAYQVLPGEHNEPTAVDDVDDEIEEAGEALREWGGV